MKHCPNPDCAAEQFPDEANFCPACAQRLAPVEVAAPSAAEPSNGGGLLGGRFRLGDRLGGARTGEIFAATDDTTGTACVVKWIHESVFPSPLLQQRTERELKQLERVQAPTIARVLAHGKQGERVWVAVERVDGQSLKSLVSRGVLSIDRARAIVLGIGRALSEAAKVGVIHRDVSPKNVLIGDDFSVKVINFGVPTPLTERVQGEPEFLSPEQVEGKPVDQRANIYSLGAVLYYMVTGQPPFVGDPNTVMQAHLSGQLVPPSQRGAVPPALEALILKALERVSSRRFMTLRQLLTEVENLDASGAADSAATTSPFAAAGKAQSQHATARTMMGMMAPDEDGKPTDVVPTQPQAPATVPAAAVASFAQPTPAPQPVVQPHAPAPQPQAPAPQPQAPAPQPQAPAPQPQAPAPQPQAPAPQPQAPAPQQPLPAASVPDMAAVSQSSISSAGGKRGKAVEKRKAKGQFRETLWFKKGELDAVAAEAAAAASQQGQDQLAPDVADALPIEDRYKDDGTLTVQDQQSYSLRTGHTQMMQSVDPQSGRAGAGMAEDELVDEMKGGRTWVIVAIVAGVLALGALAAYFGLK